MSIDLTRFYEGFFAESLDGLDKAEAGLLELETSPPTPEGLNAIFRGIHSLKGSAGSLGFTPIAEFAHHVESILDLLRKGILKPNRNALNILLDCVDHSRDLVLIARDGGATNGERANRLIRDLQSLHDSPTDLSSKLSNYLIRFEPSLGFFENGNDPLRLLRILNELGTMNATVDLSRFNTIETFEPEHCYFAWTIQLTSIAPISEIEEVFSWVADDCKLLIEIISPQPAPSTDPSNPSQSDFDTNSSTYASQHREHHKSKAELHNDRLHVKRDKVDNLINLVGELVITKTMLKQNIALLDSISATLLTNSLTQLERNTRDLQDSVMAIRMLPISHVFGRFSRMIRDISQRLEKLVQLEITGEQNELDKSVIEKLIDPLTHLVRNALDHGIEAPDIRRAKGKPEIATLRLHAQHKAGNIEIVVSDDGGGIDLERIIKKAHTGNLLDENQSLTYEQACELIFQPGFSTAATVNELSGRGVGLDVVRKNISSLNGSIKVESTPGRGTSFIIRLPLTLAIIDGMTISVGSDIYIVPMTFIVECLQTHFVKLKTVAGRRLLVEVRGKYLPLLKLGDFTNAQNAASFEDGMLIILEAEGNRIALLVDALVDQDQVVIKSLESNYRKVPYLAGATILGQGRVALILDVSALVSKARE